MESISKGAKRRRGAERGNKTQEEKASVRQSSPHRRAGDRTPLRAEIVFVCAAACSILTVDDIEASQVNAIALHYIDEFIHCNILANQHRAVVNLEREREKNKRQRERERERRGGTSIG